MFFLVRVANRLYGMGRWGGFGWVVGVVMSRGWWLVGQVVHVVMGVVGLFTCVRVVVPFL